METNSSNICSIDLGIDFQVSYIAILLSGLILCKGILVIATVYRTPSLHTNSSILVSSLCVSDILLGFAYTFIDNLEIILRQYTSNIEIIRGLRNFLLGQWHAAILTSMVHNSLIAIDRFLFIVYPFLYMKYITKRYTFVTLFFVWLLGVLYIHIPLILFNDSKYHKKCIVLHPPLTFTISGIVIYLSCVISVLICYLEIASLAFRHKKTSNKRRSQFSKNNNDLISKNNLSAAFRSAKFFFLMFVVFMVFTFPPAIITVFNTFHEVPKYVYMLVMLLIPVNSVLSVVIFFNMNKNFSLALRKMFNDFKKYLCH